jgi:hypothetical protein
MCRRLLPSQWLGLVSGVGVGAFLAGPAAAGAALCVCRRRRAARRRAAAPPPLWRRGVHPGLGLQPRARDAPHAPPRAPRLRRAAGGPHAALHPCLLTAACSGTVSWPPQGCASGPAQNLAPFWQTSSRAAPRRAAPRRAAPRARASGAIALRQRQAARAPAAGHSHVNQPPRWLRPQTSSLGSLRPAWGRVVHGGGQWSGCCGRRAAAGVAAATGNASPRARLRGLLSRTSDVRSPPHQTRTAVFVSRFSPV